MTNKMQFYAQMAEDAAKQITGSREQWTAFLRTAARLYKYPYHEQLMIYAQRPDATACASPAVPVRTAPLLMGPVALIITTESAGLVSAIRSSGVQTPI